MATYKITRRETLVYTMEVEADSIASAEEYYQNHTEEMDFCDACIEDSRISIEEVKDAEGFDDESYASSIKEIKSGKYLVNEEHGDYELGNREERIIFLTEGEAEMVREYLDDCDPGCFVIEIESGKGGHL